MQSSFSIGLIMYKLLLVASIFSTTVLANGNAFKIDNSDMGNFSFAPSTPNTTETRFFRLSNEKVKLVWSIAPTDSYYQIVRSGKIIATTKKHVAIIDKGHAVPSEYTIIVIGKNNKITSSETIVVN